MTGRTRTRRWAVHLLHGRPRSDDDALRRTVHGKTVVLTGASYGIGEATALRLGAAGATTILIARTRSRLEEVADAVRAVGGSAIVLPTDLSDLAEVEKLAARITTDCPPADVLINNAGMSIRRSIAVSLDRFHDYERTARLNYLSSVALSLGLLGGMRERGHGHLVNVLSVISRVPAVPRYSAYQASKAALDVWSRSVRTELSGDGVTVSLVHMGLVRTRMIVPTPQYRDRLSLSPDQAAALVCDAVARRPRSVGPIWLAAAETGAAAMPGLTERRMRRMYRHGHDAAGATTHRQ